ncbi:putative tRNA methyltransferase 9-like protein [Sciurus carolinensis]|uniref:tRNA methyltransferase 9-like protein n=1 Tax=Sciurus carolinensis TaxID=30640 RepID=A0AA41N1K2_SCICA|nr:putative tRNA methyltransferase 9-like protein [Sciurus carolinensis]
MDHEVVRLEKQHVCDVYESMAPYFSDLRSKAWRGMWQLLQEQKPGSLIADIGCGTGKYLKVNSQVHTLGYDYCVPLVEIAWNRGCEVMVCDNLKLPFRDHSVNAIISIGVIHHFSTKQRRIHLNGDHQGESQRIGEGSFQDSTNTSENHVAAGNLEEGNPSARKILRSISTFNSTDSNPDDTISVQKKQPDILDSRAFMRYYHVFHEGEPCDLLQENGMKLPILSSGNDHGNWCIIAEKKESCD